jgi:reactive intermediate/imine deaminase
MESTEVMNKEVIDIPIISEANRKLGSPVSMLVRAGDMLYSCGMPPIDVATGDLVIGDIRTQTRAVLQALKVCLETAGSSLDKVVKTMVYVTDPAFTDAVNEVYREFFTSNYPARGFAAITPWPYRFDIEIECIAVA